MPLLTLRVDRPTYLSSINGFVFLFFIERAYSRGDSYTSFSNLSVDQYTYFYLFISPHFALSTFIAVISYPASLHQRISASRTEGYLKNILTSSSQVPRSFSSFPASPVSPIYFCIHFYFQNI